MHLSVHLNWINLQTMQNRMNDWMMGGGGNIRWLDWIILCSIIFCWWGKINRLIKIFTLSVEVIKYFILTPTPDQTEWWDCQLGASEAHQNTAETRSNYVNFLTQHFELFHQKKPLSEHNFLFMIDGENFVIWIQ